MRGDHADDVAQALSNMGTPPRARGSPAWSSAAIVTAGNTPACAGITVTSRRATAVTGEHPRVRGDHSWAGERRDDCLGTPPRARGSRPSVATSGRSLGNTPACAGITARCRPPGREDWEHPRVRGDHEARPPRVAFGAGTPPRARGSRAVSCVDARPSGNTPACAGITPKARTRSRGCREHPRVRGDHATILDGLRQRAGTPPRARGSREARQQHSGRWWNTPACAGITWIPTGAVAGSWEHPRVRGDHRFRAGLRPPEPGTPPRARGSRRRGGVERAGGVRGTPPRARGSPWSSSSPGR